MRENHCISSAANVRLGCKMYKLYYRAVYKQVSRKHSCPNVRNDVPCVFMELHRDTDNKRPHMAVQCVVEQSYVMIKSLKDHHRTIEVQVF